MPINYVAEGLPELYVKTATSAGQAVQRQEDTEYQQRLTLAAMETQKQMEIARLNHEWQIEAFNRSKAWELEKMDTQSRAEFGARQALEQRKRAEYQTKLDAIDSSTILDDNTPKEQFGGMTEKEYMKHIITAQYLDLPDVAEKLIGYNTKPMTMQELQVDILLHPEKYKNGMAAAQGQMAAGQVITPAAEASPVQYSSPLVQAAKARGVKVLGQAQSAGATAAPYIVDKGDGTIVHVNPDQQVLAVDVQTGSMVMASMSEVADKPDRYAITQMNLTTEQQEAERRKPAQLAAQKAAKEAAANKPLPALNTRVAYGYGMGGF